MFYLHVGILHRRYLVLNAGFYKRLHYRFTDIRPDRRVALSLNYHRLPSRIMFRRSDWSFNMKRFKKSVDPLKKVGRWISYVWNQFAMDIADSSMITGRSLKRFGCYVRKNRRRISNIRSEEIQRVGRIIFISKMLLFPYTLIISTQIFRIFSFFYQVIILLITRS